MPLGISDRNSRLGQLHSKKETFSNVTLPKKARRKRDLWRIRVFFIPKSWTHTYRLTQTICFDCFLLNIRAVACAFSSSERRGDNQRFTYLLITKHVETHVFDFQAYGRFEISKTSAHPFSLRLRTNWRILGCFQNHCCKIAEDCAKNAPGNNLGVKDRGDFHYAYKFQ